MIRRKCNVFFIVIGILVLPILFVGFTSSYTTPSVWIIDTNRGDESTVLAINTLQEQIVNTRSPVKVIGLEDISLITSKGDLLVVVGHGQPTGLCVENQIIPWEDLYEGLTDHNPSRMIVLACNSPSDIDNSILGFGGIIDAEAGAILASWLVLEFLGCESIEEISFSRVAECQKAMRHPLGRVLYFIHGYFGSNSEFSDMMQAFSSNGDISSGFTAIHAFSYYSAYGISHDDTSAIEDLHQSSSIDEYAEDLFDVLNQHPSGTQINIVAHSMGGIIVRKMLMDYRIQLENNGVDIGCVVTMGTPNLGTFLADPSNQWATIAALLGGYLWDNGALWPSPVFYSMSPDSQLIQDLNDDPSSYSDGIRWYTGAGIDPVVGLLLISIHGEYSDPIVGESMAYLSFASTKLFYDVNHGTLINDEDNQETYDNIVTWLTSAPDSDGEGLDDDEEVYIYGTDPNDWDTDNDGLSDANEVLYHGTNPLSADTDGDSLSDSDEFAHGTNPLVWSTDGDIISDGNEVAWGYNPLDSSDPIPASSLISSSWQSSGITGYVRANHYVAMDYIKVYVRYKTSSGYWTGYMHVGTDYTPYTSSDYYVSWSLLQGYVQMKVKVQAYDSQNHYLGSDIIYITLPGDGGGGGGGGGKPVPE